MATEKRDVRLQVFITQKMDDRLDDVAEIMGMSKNELVRYAIANVCGAYETSVKLLREEISKSSNGKLENKNG